MQRRIIRLPAIGLVVAAGLVATPAVADARIIGSATARGDYAIALASGSANDPASIYVRVKSRPRQRVSVFWNMICSRGFGAGSKDGDFKARTTVKRKLRMPMRNPDDCTVSASGQLDGSGRIKVQLLAY